MQELCIHAQIILIHAVFEIVAITLFHHLRIVILQRYKDVQVHKHLHVHLLTLLNLVE